MISVNKLFEFTEDTQERKSIQEFLNKTNPYDRDKKQKLNEITITCNNATAYESLIPLLKHIQSMGSPGHSFDIVVDPDSSDYKKSFGFDGDGSHFIKEIKLNSINVDKIIKGNS